MVVRRNSYEENPKTQGPDAWYSDNEFVRRLSQNASDQEGEKS
jgi:hypothetical protein